MVIEIEPNFLSHLQACPKPFQERFRKAYQQLKVSDKPQDVKGLEPVVGYKSFFKLFIDKSRIGLEYDGRVLRIACFLYNQFLDEREV